MVHKFINSRPFLAGGKLHAVALQVLLGTYQGLGCTACTEKQVVTPCIIVEFLDSGGDPGSDELDWAKRIRAQRHGRTIVDLALSDIAGKTTPGVTNIEGHQSETRVYVRVADWNVAAVADSSGNTDSPAIYRKKGTEPSKGGGLDFDKGAVKKREVFCQCVFGVLFAY